MDPGIVNMETKAVSGVLGASIEFVQVQNLFFNFFIFRQPNVMCNTCVVLCRLKKKIMGMTPKHFPVCYCVC